MKRTLSFLPLFLAAANVSLISAAFSLQAQADTPATPAPNQNVLEGQAAMAPNPTFQVPCVSAMIDGKGPFTLVLDTGVTGFVLNPSAAKQLNLSPDGQVRVLNGNGDNGVEPVYKVSSLGIGSLTMSDLDVGVGASDVSHIDGAIGGALFDQYAVMFDFKDQVVKFFQPLPYFPSPGEDVIKIAMERFSDTPLTSGSVDNVSTIIGFDTGANEPLVITGAFLKSVVVKDPTIKTGLSVQVVGSTVNTEIHAASEISLGDDDFVHGANVPAALINNNVNSGPPGVGAMVSLLLFEPRTITFDYSASVIILGPATGP